MDIEAYWRLILLTSTARTSPIKHLTTELGEFTAQVIRHVVMMKSRQSGDFKLAQIRRRSEFISSQRESRIVMHVFNDFNYRLICCLLEETFKFLFIIGTHFSYFNFAQICILRVVARSNKGFLASQNPIKIC